MRNVRYMLCIVISREGPRKGLRFYEFEGAWYPALLRIPRGDTMRWGDHWLPLGGAFPCYLPTKAPDSRWVSLIGRLVHVSEVEGLGGPFVHHLFGWRKAGPWMASSPPGRTVGMFLVAVEG